jgi:hypothetical protein
MIETKAWFTRRLFQMFAWLRVMVFLTVAFALLATFFASQARAKTSEALLHVGRHLSGLEDLTDGAHTVRINGQSMRFSSTSTDASLEDVLDRFAEHCVSNSPMAVDLALAGLNPPKSDAAAFGVLRREVGMFRGGREDGMVACLAGKPQGESLVAGLARFAETLELGEVGELRYAYARTKTDGSTHVMTVWTYEGFDFKALLPPPGHDAPGGDAPGAPRPAGSVRLLSAEVAGTPHGVWVYDVPGKGVANVVKSQDESMQRAGWQTIPGTDHLFGEDGTRAGRIYAGENEELFFAAAARGESTSVSFARSGFGPRERR